ncbi:unnamed protein product [Haemonchus placei]|uniref:Secreted protein n=1 Tax=Haemonchus placei TaxID=6290 RepID=A0A0N4WF75_HAEPC|nr:unnamed protein product [Haemonchus placei]
MEKSRPMLLAASAVAKFETTTTTTTDGQHKKLSEDERRTARSIPSVGTTTRSPLCPTWINERSQNADRNRGRV